MTCLEESTVLCRLQRVKLRQNSPQCNSASLRRFQHHIQPYGFNWNCWNTPNSGRASITCFIKTSQKSMFGNATGRMLIDKIQQNYWQLKLHPTPHSRADSAPTIHPSWVRESRQRRTTKGDFTFPLRPLEVSMLYSIIKYESYSDILCGGRAPRS